MICMMMTMMMTISEMSMTMDMVSLYFFCLTLFLTSGAPLKTKNGPKAVSKPKSQPKKKQPPPSRTAKQPSSSNQSATQSNAKGNTPKQVAVKPQPPKESLHVEHPSQQESKPASSLPPEPYVGKIPLSVAVIGHVDAGKSFI